MRINWIKKALSFILAGAMVICLSAAASVPATAYAEETEGGGKYVSDVFIAYGKNEKNAKKWLTDNGWEPVAGDFNAGKASFFDNNDIQDQNVAAVMGIKRTDDKYDAITDMAVMNMTGGYSIPDYESLLNQKKGEIKEYINHFTDVIEEYRANCNKKGSEFGAARAQLAKDMLDKFYDGGKDEPYAVNDTGEKLGTLFTEKTKQEGNEAGGDLEQILLESSGPALLLMETFLAFGADDGKETWLERASGLTGDELEENLVKYVPEAAGQDVAPSAIPQFLNQAYGDTAAALADQWGAINEEMLWYEEYSSTNDLWPYDDEDDEAYAERENNFFDELIKEKGDEGEEEQNKYANAQVLYYNLYEVPYSGEWGETLGDFFNPADEEWNNPDADCFLPLAAGLSEGQRASMDFLSLRMLMMIGFGDLKAVKQAMPDIKKEFGDMENISIYTGVNRAAFRGGVAITSEALMEQNAGRGQAYDQIWDNTGIVAMSSYVAAAVGAITLVSGIVMKVKGVGVTYTHTYTGIFAKERVLRSAQSHIKEAKQVLETATDPDTIKWARNRLEITQRDLNKNTITTAHTGTATRWMMGVGGAILIAAAIVKGVQLYKYYDRDMTPIPLMIVDESDIVTYLTDDNGKPILDNKGEQKKTIDFKTYEYYSAVKCNRPDVGEIGDWNDGVKEYEDHNCYDIADLNADMGQEWLALYTVKSEDKGDPILADTLTLKYGSNKNLPEGCTKGLHLFTYTSVLDLGDTAWAYNNKKGGVRFYWGEDEGAFAAKTASAFGAGQMALAGIGGLILGILGTTLVFNKKRRKEEPEAA